jgi:hypothetical protein
MRPKQQALFYIMCPLRRGIGCRCGRDGERRTGSLGFCSLRRGQRPCIRLACTLPAVALHERPARGRSFAPVAYFKSVRLIDRKREATRNTMTGRRMCATLSSTFASKLELTSALKGVVVILAPSLSNNTDCNKKLYIAICCGYY